MSINIKALKFYLTTDIVSLYGWYCTGEIIKITIQLRQDIGNMGSTKIQLKRKFADQNWTKIAKILNVLIDFIGTVCLAY